MVRWEPVCSGANPPVLEGVECGGLIELVLWACGPLLGGEDPGSCPPAVGDDDEPRHRQPESGRCSECLCLQGRRPHLGRPPYRGCGACMGGLGPQGGGGQQAGLERAVLGEGCTEVVGGDVADACPALVVGSQQDGLLVYFDRRLEDVRVDQQVYW